MSRATEAILIVFLMSGLSACTKKSDQASGVPGKVRVGQLGGTNSPMSILAVPKWGDVPAASGNYSWAKVEGLKIELNEVFGTHGSEREQFIRYDFPKQIELVGDTGAIHIQDDITAPVAAYSDVGVTFSNKVSIKGFCRANGQALYTTATGIKKCTGSCGATDNLPSDYDYYNQDFMLPEFSSTVMEANKLNFSVSEGSTPVLTLLVDTAYTVTCANTLAQIDNMNDPGKMAPFVWSLQHGKYSDYYKGTEGNFGFGYLPIFTYLTTDPNEALPVGETYAASATQADITATPVNVATSMITSVAFDENNNIVAARSRNFGSPHGTTLEQGWSGFSQDTANSYTMMNGEHWGGAVGDFSDARWLQDRKIVGFQRSNYTTTQNINVVDGPDCGKNLSDRNKPCQTTGPKMTYWRRILR